MLVIGLTGGIGSGKTTVARRFEAHGVPVIDADAIARKLVEPGEAAYYKILELFGPGVAEDNQQIDRAALRKIIFSDPEKRTQLEGILHPLVRNQMRENVQKLNNPYCILMIPLLIEAGQMDMVDRILLVRSDEELQVQRASERDGVPATAIEQIIATQADPKTREAVANDILDNNADLNSLYIKIDALHKQYTEQATKPEPAPTHTKTEDISQQTCSENAGSEPAPQNRTVIEPDTSNQIVYELPLNERLRTLLRLESLFMEFDDHASGDTVWQSRAAIKTLLALQSALNRPDIKTELIKEIDRLKGVLAKYAETPDVDRTALDQTCEELAGMSKALRAYNAHFGQDLKQNELMIAVKQRETMPGGPSTFDIPCYGFWLNRNPAQRQQDLQCWIREFALLRQATALILRIVRESAAPTEETAENGTFQLILEQGPNYQLIRVLLPTDSDCCAEISGGRQRFGIRFIKPQTDSRPMPAQEPVSFLLSCCAI